MSGRKTGPKFIPLSVRFDRGVDRSGGPDACWPWMRGTSNGYGKISSGGRGHPSLRTHRVAYEFAHGLIPAGLCVCHRCDNPLCCNPAHLFAGTLKDNTQDMLAKGRHGARTKPESTVRGERVLQAKLTEPQVLEIRRRYAAGDVSRRELGAEYGVTQRTIERVVGMQLWKHVRSEAA